MSAATANIDTPERSGSILNLPIAASTRIYAGTLVAVDSNGRAVPAADTAGLRVIGRAEEEVDNSTGAAGALTVSVKRGTFKFGNSTGDAVDANDLGKIAFVEDDNTVCETGATHKVKAGRVIAVDSDGVWVDTAEAHVVPSADTITGAADLAALKTAVLAILQAQGLVK
jgi:hypothetical protein